MVVLCDDPGNAGSDTTLFRGKVMTYYGMKDYKVAQAVRHGATGVLIIHDTTSASTASANWTLMQTYYSNPALFLQTPDRRASKEAFFAG